MIAGRTLEHDPEKWKPVFGEDHAQKKLCKSTQVKSPVTPSGRCFLTFKDGGASRAVFVMPMHPSAHVAVRPLISAKWRKIEETIGAEQFFAGAGIGRVRVINRAVLVLEEHALAVQF